MDKKQILEKLRGQRLDPSCHKDIKEFMLSSKIIRCADNDTSVVAVGNETKKDDQIHGFVDAVHYHTHTQGEAGKLIYVIGRRKSPKEHKEVLNCISSLLDSLSLSIDVELQVDFIPIAPVAEGFDDALRTRKWFKKITDSQDISLPSMAKKISAAMKDDAFRWYRNVTGKNWSGRVEGLQVCSIDLKDDVGTLEVGKEGKEGDGPVRKIFIEIAGENVGQFSEHQIPSVAATIKKLIDSREFGKLNKYQREHLLESRVLRGILALKVDDMVLEPVVTAYPFQFPTLWSPAGNPRYLDALMKCGNIPWAVELKEPTGSSPGQDYRHAITQAVLYRQFIRKATSFHEWFSRQGLDALQCQCAVAFPKMERIEAHQKLLKQHQSVARAFDVSIIEIEGWNVNKRKA
jgi:hypothetical protein